MSSVTPRVSILTPFLDAERHLEAAIESVRAQTTDDWELLLIDDGSRDASAAIAARYAAAEPHLIRLLAPDPDRRGAAAARNRGLEAARGELIACLDADDLYLPEKLARDIRALEADPGALWVYSATRWFFDEAAGRRWLEHPGVRRDRSYDGAELLVRVMLRERGDIPCTCAVMIRRTAMQQVGGFEEGFALYEDQALWAKLLLRGRVRVRSGCDALYRQHPGSTSVAATERGDYDPERPHPARRAFLEWLHDYCADQGLASEVLEATAIALSDSAGGPLVNLGRRLRRSSRYVPWLP